MAVKRDFENQILEYIDTHPDSKTGTWPLEIEGEIHKQNTYKLPIDLLRYNVSNGRLAMEVLDTQSSLGRPLDATNPEDIDAIRNLLLDLDRNKTDELKKDLQRVGQEQPGVISSDGTVINGNRRMAVFQDLHDKVDASGKWDRLEVVVLPKNISESQLWKIEAGLQLSQSKVAEYHPVNELLKIKQGLAAGLSEKQIADVLFGRTLEQIKDGIERLKLIESFLIFFGQAKNYGLIKKFGLHEYFINVQKSILRDADKYGIQEKTKRLEFTFALIKSHVLAQANKDAEIRGLSHFAIRELGKIFQSNKAYIQFKSAFEGAKNIQQIDPETVLEGFRGAKEILELEAESSKPKKLLDKAIRAIGSIDPQSISKEKEDLRIGVKKLLTMVQELKTRIDKK